MESNDMDSKTSGEYRDMPKMELHAHLSGSISPQCLHDIWSERVDAGDAAASALPDPLTIMGGDKTFDLSTFFPLFSKYIYTLISTPTTITRSTLSVLSAFAADGVIYLELRTTPRSIPSAGISKNDYISLVLAAISSFSASNPRMVTRLILSIDRRSTLDQAREVVDLALHFRHQGVVGVDLCNDPSKSDISPLGPAFALAKSKGLGVTLHFGEVARPPVEGELETLLGWWPDRIGHVIYVPEDLRSVIRERKMGLELCLSCNVRMGMMEGGYADHHFEYWRGTGCPITLCTDDVGIVGSHLSNEYALIAQHFKMEKSEVHALARSGIDTIFGGEEQKERLRGLMW